MDIQRIIIRVAKQRPDSLFEAEFFDIKEAVKTYRKDLAEKAAAKIEKKLRDEIHGLLEMKLSLGKFRGTYFITSCKMTVKVNETQAKKLETVFKTKYSPKFNYKGLDDNGNALFNVR